MQQYSPSIQQREVLDKVIEKYKLDYRMKDYVNDDGAYIFDVFVPWKELRTWITSHLPFRALYVGKRR